MPPISTNSHLSLQSIKHKKTMAYGIGNPGPDLEQTQKCGGVKLVNGIANPPPSSDNWIPNDHNLIFILSFHPVKSGLLVIYNPPCLFEIRDGCHQHH